MVHLIITGATGTAGSQALRVALTHPSITKITVLSRRPLPPHVAPTPPSPKLTVIEHADFLAYPPALLAQLDGADGCLWDLGISANGMKEAEYEVITKDYAVAAAKAFAQIQRDDRPGKFVFAYLSGAGTNQSGKSWAMFGRVKGRAEAALAALRSLPTLTTYSFRPAGIVPVAPVPESGFLQRVIGPPLFAVMGVLSPGLLIKTDVLATGMIEAVLRGASGEIAGWEGKGARGDRGVFENDEIKRLAEETC